MPAGSSAGEMRYWDGTNWVAIAIGEQGQTLTWCNGVPAWGPCPGNDVYGLLLQVEPEEGGSVLGGGSYEEGVSIEISATANEGWEFVNWTGDTGGLADVNDAETILTMPAGNVTLTANFQMIDYTLTLIANPEAGGTVEDVTDDAPYNIGDIIEIKAEPSEGWEFVNWTGDTEYLDDPATATTTVTMPAQSISLTANFEEEDDSDIVYGGGVTDIDGNEYVTVIIGEQEWMAENLKYLPSVVGPATGSETTPHYYVYGYVGTDVAEAKATTNYQNYGVLYNWWATIDNGNASASNPSDVQGICPDDWHLPSDAEWKELTDYLGGENVAGKKMKSRSGWSDGGNGTNISGFNGEPGGMRNEEGLSDRMGGFGYWWSSTEYTPTQAFARRLVSSDDECSRNHTAKAIGRSVRCIANYGYFSESPQLRRSDVEDKKDTGLAQDPGQKEYPPGPAEDIVNEPSDEDVVKEPSDEDAVSQDTHSSTIIIDDYVVIDIGDYPSQVWMTKNLNVSTFRNGEAIPHALTLGDWLDAGNERKPAWSYYGNEPSNGEIYGKLYNWYAVNDPRGLCPQGWRIPTKDDYELLITSDGGMEHPYDYEDLIYGGHQQRMMLIPGLHGTLVCMIQWVDLYIRYQNKKIKGFLCAALKNKFYCNKVLQLTSQLISEIFRITMHFI